MTTITTRAGKGSPLTNTEVDANFTNLNNDKLEDISGESIKDLSDVNSGMTPSDGQVLTYDSTTSKWTAEDSAGGVTDIVEDTTPQLGGTLDANGHDIDMGTNTITDTKVGQWDTAYGWGNHASSGYITGNQTITFSGDVSGSGTTSIVITVADDSHNHIISNVDGLQDALDAKQSSATALTTSTSFGGDVSGTYNAIVVADDSHNHIISNVDGLQTALDAKQPLDADLTAIGALAKTDGNFIVGNGTTWIAESGATARTSLGLGGLATLSAVGASEITDNSVGAAELNVSGNGTTSQYLRSDGDGTFTWATPPDTNTTYSAGTALDLSGTTFNVDLSELTTSTADGDGDYFVVVDAANAQKKLTKANINLSGFNNDSGWTSNTGDITGVTAGDGLTGGGASGSVTLNVGAGTGISVAADTVSLATAGAGAATYSSGISAVTVDAYGRVTAVTGSAGYTTNTGTVTSVAVSAGTGLSGGGTVTTSGTISLAIDLNELATSTSNADGDYFVVVDSADGSNHKLTKANIALSGFNNDAGWTSNVGDITGVTAGSYLTGGGTSGGVTLNVDATTTATASKVVARDASGDDYRRYGFAQYFNMSHSATTRNSDTVFYSSTDAYIRKNTAAGMRSSLGLGSLATLSTVNASTITDNSVGAAELNVSGNGTTSQFLRSDGDGTFTWATPAASAASDIFWENGTNVTSNYTITSGKNAMSAGPITINSGVTVTVPSGSTWTVV